MHRMTRLPLPIYFFVWFLLYKLSSMKAVCSTQVKMVSYGSRVKMQKQLWGFVTTIAIRAISLIESNLKSFIWPQQQDWYNNLLVQHDGYGQVSCVMGVRSEEVFGHWTELLRDRCIPFSQV